jgi:fatty-acyl-CoA synthase
LQKLELKDLMAREQPQAIFVEDMFVSLPDSSILPESQPKIIVFGESNCAEYDGILATKPRDVKIPLTLNDPFLYVHTGGTTAVPKICIVPHRQMVWNVFEALLTSAGATPSREFVLFPFFHIGGWNVFFCLFMSNSLSITLRQFDAGIVLDFVNRKMVNRLGAVEVMLQFLSGHPKFAETDFSGIELITTAAAPCSEKTLKPFWDRNIPTIQAYGQTEAGPANFIFQPREASMEHIKANARKVGTPFFCCDYKIIDQSDHSKTVPDGEPGVLCVRSLHNFNGYLNDPARTEKLMDAEGWIFTGDLAVTDSEGLVSIVGRADNMFITGGENVSPEEIEIALRSHPAVAASICAGIPDEKWGEVPMAMVMLNPGQAVTEEELRAHCKERLAAYKVPKRVEIAAAIPMTPMGKLDRNALKRHFMANPVPAK